MINWIDVDDELPEDGLRILTYNANNDSVSSNIFYDGDIFVESSINVLDVISLRTKSFGITHWALFNAPKD